MFFGMTLCFIPHGISLLISKYNKAKINDLNEDEIELNSEIRLSFKNSFVFLPAAIFDLISTSIQYFALNLTNSSSYQMLSGI
jgi:hypothetical protein